MLSLEFISGVGMHPVDFIAMAARLGCDAVGLAPEPICGPVAGERWNLRGNRVLQSAVKAALADHGITLALGEGFLIMPGRNVADAVADLDMFAELGARLINVVVIEPDGQRASDQFAALVGMAEERGLPTSVEFMPGMPVGNLADALALIKGTGSDRAGVLIDAMHLFASGGTAGDIQAIDPKYIFHAQLCDARLQGFYEGYYYDARCNRPGLGDGILPLAEFVAALPAACQLGLEIPMLARAEAGGNIEQGLRSSVELAKTLRI